MIAPFWPQKEGFPELQSLAVAPPVSLPLQRDLLKQPHFHRLHQNLPVLCLHAWRLQRFTRPLGLSSRVATQLSLCHRQSSQRLYQHRWECYRSWCHSKGHCVSAPSVAKIADFLRFLCLEKHLSVSAIKGYHSTLSADSICQHVLENWGHELSSKFKSTGSSVEDAFCT